MCMMRGICRIRGTLKKEYEGRLEVVTIKQARFWLHQKYGATTKSMLVINESKAVRNINKETIVAAFEEAINSCC